MLTNLPGNLLVYNMLKITYGMEEPDAAGMTFEVT